MTNQTIDGLALDGQDIATTDSDEELRPAGEHLPLFLTPPDGDGQPVRHTGAGLTLVREPDEQWSTEELQEIVAVIEQALKEGDEPATLIDPLNTARGLLKERGERRPGVVVPPSCSLQGSKRA